MAVRRTKSQAQLQAQEERLIKQIPHDVVWDEKSGMPKRVAKDPKMQGRLDKITKAGVKYQGNIMNSQQRQKDMARIRPLYEEEMQLRNQGIAARKNGDSVSAEKLFGQAGKLESKQDLMYRDAYNRQYSQRTYMGLTKG